MNVWISTQWKKYIDTTLPTYRSGLRLKIDQDANPEIRQRCIDFAKWLRTKYCFPIRIPIYIKSRERIIAQDGDLVCGTFFGPYSMNVEPYIRIAVGDYEELCKQIGNFDATIEILQCMSHELTHYYQWINQLNLTEIGKERQASRYAKRIVEDYISQSPTLLDTCHFDSTQM